DGGSGNANAGGNSGAAGHGGNVQSGGPAGHGGRGGAGAGGHGGSAGACGGGDACGQNTWRTAQVSIPSRSTGRGRVPPWCIPIPSGCGEALDCGCFKTDPCGGCTKCQSVMASTIVCGNCQCVCAAAWSPVATPNGSRRIADLHVGELVYTIDHGERVALPI